VAKDWRIVICARWRLPLGVLLFALLAAASGVALALTAHYRTEHLTHLYDQNLAKLEVGMGEDELVRIMGNPTFITKVKSADWQSIPDEVKQRHENVLCYDYELISIYSNHELRSSIVFLDEAQKRIVYITPSFSLWLLKGPRALDIFFLILGLEALLVLLAMRLWCRKRSSEFEGDVAQR
jgi:hypothetical protein